MLEGARNNVEEFHK